MAKQIAIYFSLCSNSCRLNRSKFHYRNACTAKLDVFVVSREDTRNRIQVLTNDLPQGSCACAVKNADAGGIDQQRIVDEVGDGLQSLVCTHSAHINLLSEVEVLLSDAVLRLACEKRTAPLLLFRR